MQSVDSRACDQGNGKCYLRGKSGKTLSNDEAAPSLTGEGDEREGQASQRIFFTEFLNV